MSSYTKVIIIYDDFGKVDEVELIEWRGTEYGYQNVKHPADIRKIIGELEGFAAKLGEQDGGAVKHLD